MKLGDIYIKKDNKEEIIQIDSFATRMGKLAENSLIIFVKIEKCGNDIVTFPSFDGYGTIEEIESEYDLLISQEDLDKYNTWDKVFELAESLI